MSLPHERSSRAARPDATPELEQRLGRLRGWNIIVGLILAVQAVAIALLTNGFTLPVTATYMTGPPGTAPELTTLFDVPLGWGVFAFLAISAAALFIIASPGVFGWYKRNLLQDRNYGRWIEYFFSSSHHDRAHQHDHRRQRHRGAARDLRRQREHDPLRPAHGEVRDAGQAQLALVLVRHASPASSRGSSS